MTFQPLQSTRKAHFIRQKRQCHKYISNDRIQGHFIFSGAVCSLCFSKGLPLISLIEEVNYSPKLNFTLTFPGGYKMHKAEKQKKEPIVWGVMSTWFTGGLTPYTLTITSTITKIQNYASALCSYHCFLSCLEMPGTVLGHSRCLIKTRRYWI